MELLDGMGNLIFESVMKSTDAYLYAMNENGKITRWSPNAVDNFELPGEYVEDSPAVWRALIHPDDVEAYEEDFNKIFTGEKDYHQCEYRVRKRSGEYVWVRCRGQATRASDGSVEWFIGLIREISGINKVDYSTQLFNIFEFRRKLNLLLEAGLCNGGILLLGIDNFRKINAMYSYSVGNRVLLRVAEAFESVCPVNVDLYRIEGDKFAFACPRYTQREISQLFNAAREAIYKLDIDDGEFVRLSVSGGALMLNDNYTNVDEIHKDLEHALSISKQEAEGLLTFFSEELLQDSLKDLRLREELRRCVENDFQGFELYYQPIMTGDGRKLSSCEALLRWKNEKFPNTYPDKFIPILEETGLIVRMGGWIGTNALLQLKEWRKYKPDLKINVNVSYVQIKSSKMVENVVKGMKDIGMPMDSLVMEITESCEVRDVENVVLFVNTMREMGVQIALDDFGTGYSSIRILQQIPADWIKLDHNFVSKILDNEFDRNIVKYLMGLCHSLGYKVCVEGVEDEMCFELVKKEGAEAIQGYYYSRPIPAESFFQKYIKE